jgi:GNAT superfamily N-acetyltransferase
MKIIDATWEKRNLGVSCTEVIVEDGDDYQLVERKLIELNSNYMVVKIPIKRLDFAQMLSNNNFTCVETLFELKYTLNDSKTVKDLKYSILYSQMNEGDIENLYNQIERGMFNSDRVFLDHHFTKKQAFNRYVGWVKDELEMGSSLFKNIYNGDQIGFFGVKKKEKGVFHQFLVGMYPEYQKKGMGASLVMNAIDYAREQGGSFFSTTVSSNNLPSLKLHLSCGLLPDSACYVYTKFNVGKGS